MVARDRSSSCGEARASSCATGPRTALLADTSGCTPGSSSGRWVAHSAGEPPRSLCQPPGPGSAFLDGHSHRHRRGDGIESAFVPKRLQGISGDGFEHGDVLSSHVLSPVSDPHSGRLEQVRVLDAELEGHPIDATLMVGQHLGTIVKLDEPADPVEWGLRIGHQVLVPDLEIPAGAELAPAAHSPVHSCGPVTGPFGDAYGTPRPIEQRERNIAAVPDDVNEPGLVEQPGQEVEVPS